MIDVNELRKGVTFEVDDQIFRVLEYTHNKPGRGNATIRCKLRNLKTGATIERTFQSGDRMQDIRLDHHQVQYLYQDGDSLVCMDNQTYEQIYLDKVLLGDSVNYIKEGVTLLIAFENGTQPITAEAPAHVVVNVTYTEPGVQGDTATHTLKAATIETGAEIRVPLFVNTGDNIKIKTASGEYVERVK